MASDMSWDRQYARSEAAIALSDVDLDALTRGVLPGDYLAGDDDPHYPDLPCYVPLVDEDETLDLLAVCAE